MSFLLNDITFVVVYNHWFKIMGNLSTTKRIEPLSLSIACKHEVLLFEKFVLEK
jgi:hypothetical protein